MKARTVVSFLVEGTPVSQGSKVPGLRIAPGTKHGVLPYLRDDNPEALKAWRKAVRSAAEAAWGGRAPLEGAVALVVDFRFVKPKTVTREFMTVKPDKDKLERAICDALTDAGVWGDDKQVVVSRTEKRYADAAGAFVQVGVIEGEGEQ